MKQTKTNLLFVAIYIVAMFAISAIFSSCSSTKGTTTRAVLVCHEECYFKSVANPNSHAREYKQYRHD
jgi:hypothetical protein